MIQRLAIGVVLFGIVSNNTQAAVPAESLEELETVVVVGQQPGPGLWKVLKDDHVLWVLAAHSPLPKDMTWLSKTVESRIAESQEVLFSRGIEISPDVGLLRGLTLIPAALRATKIPNGKTLKDVLHAETYAKWLALRKKYIGKDDDAERYRPTIALHMLQTAALNKVGLQGGNVYAVVGSARRKHKVRRNTVPPVKRTVKLEDPRGILKSARDLTPTEVACFARGIDHLEADLERARALAGAWAHGDIEALRNLYRGVPRDAAIMEDCSFAVLATLEEDPINGGVQVKKVLDDILWHTEQANVQAQHDWVLAAQAALAKNQSTFAVLPAAAVFGTDGHISKLRELGYTVEEPR